MRVDASCLRVCVSLCAQVRKELELYFQQDLSDMKRLIDEKMMMILGQMEFSRYMLSACLSLSPSPAVDPLMVFAAPTQ